MKVTSLSLASNQAEETRGKRLLAHFDAEVRGFLLRGCRLLLLPSGYTAVTTPFWQSKGSHTIGVSVLDRDLHDEMNAAVRTAYRALGGELPEIEHSAPVEMVRAAYRTVRDLPALSSAEVEA